MATERSEGERAEAEFELLPTGCRSRRCFGLGQAGGSQWRWGSGCI
jgi:hypothetical protein